MPRVVFLRHGESIWNAENRFTGWADVDLSAQGEAEAKEAGRCLREKGYKFDVIFTSMLRRAIKTTWHVCMESENFSMPIINSWRLNERHYGGLQGLNKSETAAKHGEEQVKIWRRSYDIPPPSIDKSDPRHPANDPLYKDIPACALPGAESLALTVQRATPLWTDSIAPIVACGQSVLVAAHGNSLRALCKYIEKMSEKDVLELNIPTGVPLVYELDWDLNFIKKYYLMDPAEVAKKLAAVAAQGAAQQDFTPPSRLPSDQIPSSIVPQRGKWCELMKHAQVMKAVHLRKLLADSSRNDSMFVEWDDFILDYCRQKVTRETMQMLIGLANEAGLDSKRTAMFKGDKINETEGRSVLHVALRMPKTATLMVDGKNVVSEVWSVLDAIKAFSDKVRSGEWKGHTGKPLTDVLCIGIGGSYLGVEFVFEALRTEPTAAEKAKGRNLRFLANVDPIDVKRALSGLAAETTLVIIVSKTFTTAETMLNARTVKAWLIKELGTEACVAKHVVACSTALEKTTAFGIDPKNVFGFWDWVGGRFSVWSAVGMLPLSLQYGFDVMGDFLQGANKMDDHFCTAPPEKNLPVLVGLLSVWNASCLGYEACAVLPYCQALVRFVAHIQQLDMESNGKRVRMDGMTCTTATGALYFGEPGTNGQHSFYQLMHQGRVIPSEFIGFKTSHNPVKLDGEAVSNHDELMSNFFAQPDALALGKTAQELKAEGVPDKLIPHKSFPGDRPSLSLLLPVANAMTLGKLLALYEHRTAVQGWAWGINSFDQWGVQLGKVLATGVGKYLAKKEKGPADRAGFNAPTQDLLASYLPPCTWSKLMAHARAMKAMHVRTLLKDAGRNDKMFVEECGIILDYCRQKVDAKAMDLLFALASEAGVEANRNSMFAGEKINQTEGRSVLHVALRMPRNKSLTVDGKNVVSDVWSVLDAIKGFSDKVRSGEWKGHTGKPLTDVVCIGIGGSYLGVEFVFEALRTDPKAAEQAKGRGLRFLANVDPIDVKRALSGLSAETTLVVVVSKTFTTAETMLNAKTVKQWLIQELGTEACIAKHVVACSTALEKTTAFGIDPKNVFGFWDWVGGRFSVWSAVGMLALSLQYGFGICEEFLQGAQIMDQHFQTAPPENNLPMLVGLLSVWNASCLGYEACAVLPYCQALVRFVAHIQQLDMESNGKRVRMDGSTCQTSTGALYFGEPGTNGQHSFYQLMHQGRAIPGEFIGFKTSQNPVFLDGEPVSNHDELMSNFFAQPDALALGKTAEELRAEGVPEKLVPHKGFPGDRPSLSMLLPICDAKNLGLLLALYEHRTAVQGWCWGINSFDQWGVQLGKVLATNVGKYVGKARKAPIADPGFPKPTKALLDKYLEPYDTLTRLTHHAQTMKATHLRTLLGDGARNDAMFVEGCGIILDYCRQKVSSATMRTLFELAQEKGLSKMTQAMFSGEKINETEKRSVLHVALRMPRNSALTVDGKNVVADVWSVLDAIKGFSDKVRSGEWKGHTGKPLTDVVCIGIGGSYLGVEFVFEALRTDPKAAEKAKGKGLRFLANVDPIDVKRALAGLSAETTLVVVVSKTFTTAETMLNAKTVKDWLIKELGTEACVSKHIVACSTAIEKTTAFGIDPKNVFGFWDWVGGRFSVWSAVGMLALSLQYGFETMQEFLDGAQAMDEHFRTAPLEKNLPVLVGLLSVWNASCLGYEACAVLPYCQALVRFVAHIQQLDMESNGKRVQMNGTTCTTSTGALYFGEPGTNGQHSFYQLMHQGRAIPAEFIGFKTSQNPVTLAGEPVSNHDELMSNFFAQPDALALGKTAQELIAEGVPEKLVPHKSFPGDRPSLSLLLPICDARNLGLLLALYEHRTAVQGWMWGINSFDQWGVQLGKVLATDVSKYFAKARNALADNSKFIAPTRCMLEQYLPSTAWKELFAHAQVLKSVHLRSLLKDQARNDSMFVEAGGIVLDYCRQKVTTQTMQMLMKLAELSGLQKKKEGMFAGSKINQTEGRSVLHVALRMPRNATLMVDGKNVVSEVWTVLDAIKGFSDKVRSGEWKGHTGKPLTDVVCIGIGGSYLGVEFVLEALRTEPKAAAKATGRTVRFLANVDPIDVKRALHGLSAETTLVVVVSKTFTTAETMLNAKTVKEWLVKELGTEACVAKHVVACSTALDKTKAFGIDPNNVFGFWDWVGGRFSVWSAVGALTLSLQYSFDIMEEFLQGAQKMDEHFRSAQPAQNLPMLAGMLSVWNASCLGYEACAVLPYCQACVRFVAHIQQLDMESNGKRVLMDGQPCTMSTGALYFGEPGTNGQHSFYQLMHQGRAIPAEFIGFKASQNPIQLPGEPVSNHDELMSNFFAQPDALALGKTETELRAEGVPEKLVAHKTFPGDRPSLSLLLPVCDASTLGQLLAFYEHRTAVQGWLWGVNSFDQWGVELGKVLAKEVRTYLAQARKGPVAGGKLPGQTKALIAEYL